MIPNELGYAEPRTTQPPDSHSAADTVVPALMGVEHSIAVLNTFDARLCAAAGQAGVSGQFDGALLEHVLDAL